VKAKRPVPPINTTNEIIKAAEEYLDFYLYVVPIEPGTKAPKIPGWNKLRLSRPDFPEKFGGGQQLGALLGVAPRFYADVDIDDLKALEIVNKKLVPSQPATGWSFGRKSKPHSHHVYVLGGEFKSVAYEDDADPSYNQKRGEKPKHTLIEIRGTNQQTVFPPSTHLGGERIVWDQPISRENLGESNLAVLEGWVRRVAVATLLARHYLPFGGDHHLMLAFAGWLSLNGWGEEDVTQIVMAAATIAEDPDLRERRRNVSSTFNKISQGETAVTQRGRMEELWGEKGKKLCRLIAKWLGLSDRNVENPAEVNQNDTNNASYCAEFYAGRLRRQEATNETFYVDAEDRWHVDRTNHAFYMVGQAFQQRRVELAASGLTGKEYNHASRWINKSLDANRIAAAQRILFALPATACEPDPGEVSFFDTDRMLLGLENGILDMTTGEVLSGRKDLLVAKRAPLRYDKDARCERFDRYMAQVQPDEEVRNFILEFAGVCLTGWQLEPCLLFFHGTGANGKTAFVDLLSTLLGSDYHWAVEKAMFFHGRDAREVRPNDRVDVAGKRLITAAEADDSSGTPVWNVGMIKTLFGGEVMQGAQKYVKAMNFRCYAKGIVSMNLSPKLTGFGEALSRRFLKVPWTVTVPKEQRVEPVERFVKQMLDDGGASGILNRLLEAMSRVRDRDWKLTVPKVLRETTEEYFDEADVVKRFIKEWCQEAPKPNGKEHTEEDRWTDTAVLHRAYLAWLNEPASKYTMKAKRFTSELKRLLGDNRWRRGTGNRSQVLNLFLTSEGEKEAEARGRSTAEFEFESQI
jgi:P4 family phage/plasmid primase-like protien